MMTLVVAVEGPANADILVRECVAHDGTPDASYQLTDQVGGWVDDGGGRLRDLEVKYSIYPRIIIERIWEKNALDLDIVYVVCLIDLQEGCVLGSRKKVLGSWQKTRDTGNPSLPVIAFSHFQVLVLTP